MGQLISHRGPDEEGEWHEPGITLGIQRLRILDLNTGQQPVTNEDRTVHAVFNGEIYNFRDLRDELRLSGHRFVSQGDSEVLVHLYEQLGDGFVSRLRGMFAIALWDSRRRTLVLVRDRLGKKPLYYAITHGELAFASEIKALLGPCGLSREVEADALADYLAQLYVPSPRTIFRHVRSLPPGCLGVWQNGRLTVIPYWRVPEPQQGQPVSEQEWIARIDTKLTEAVQIRTISDVPLGAFLSGGLDSSLLVAMLARHGRVKTFTVGFDDGERTYSELDAARRVAQLFGTDHTEAVVECNVLDLLPKAIWHFDQPFGNSTAPLVYLLSEFTSQHVRVALSGTGGDEQFSGYPRYLGLALAKSYNHIPRVVRARMLKPLLGRLPESTNGNSSRHRLVKRIHRFVDESNLPASQRYASWLTYFDAKQRTSILAAEFREQVAGLSGNSLHRLWPQSGDVLQRAWYIDLQAFLPYNQLEYLDKMTMAHSLEGRAPFCDQELVELCATLPANERIRGLTTKYILKRVAEKYLPKDVVHRQKVGFDAPVGAWFKKALRPFAESFFLAYPFKVLDSASVQGLYREHAAGRRDFSTQLWMLLVLEVWYELYIEQKTVTEPSVGIADVLGLERSAAG